MSDDTMDIRFDQPDADPGWRLRLEDKLGFLQELRIVGFRSRGAPDLLVVKGRLVEAMGVEGSPDEGSLLENIRTTVWRLESDEIPGAVVAVRHRGREWKIETDSEGFFRMEVDPGEPLDPGWHTVDLEVVEAIGDRKGITGSAEVFVPDEDAEFAVVSDLDDTVIKTHATDFFQQLALVFGRNARSRPAFPGVDEFYRALELGPDAKGRNPIFYVSMSGWNLYDLFVEFMDRQDLPKGPLFLTDLHVVEDPSYHMGHENHKVNRIELLLETYPDLPFVLVGDSGQEDPERYEKIVRKHPERIRAVYIRDVDPEEEEGRDREVRELADRLEEDTGVPMIFADNTAEMAEHAEDVGLIAEEALEGILEVVERERREGTTAGG